MLRPGVLLGRDLVDASGQTLLYRGVCLTETYIEGLHRRGYEYVYVKGEDDPDIEVEENLSPVIRMRAVRAISKTMDEIAQNLGALRKESFEDVVKALSSDRVKALMSQRALFTEMSEAVSQMIEELLTKSTLAGLTSIKSKDAQLYEHSIDVCVVSIMIGKAINLPGARLRQLATGCLLHDIGMLFVDAAQTDSVRIKQHTILGYELLKNTDDPDILSPHVAYEHHEHQDGTGLPRGLFGSNHIKRDRDMTTPIPTIIGEIAAIANWYDNLLSGAHGEKPVTPDVALAKIAQMAGTMLNRELVSTFRRIAPVFPKGTEVSLLGAPYEKFRGLVSEVNPTNLERPFVVLLRDGAGNKIPPLEIDTSKYPQVALRIMGV